MSIQLATVQHICVRKLPKQDDLLSSSSSSFSPPPPPSFSLWLFVSVSLSLSVLQGIYQYYCSFGYFDFSIYLFHYFPLLNFWGLICCSFCFFLGLMLRSWIFSVFFHCMRLGHSFVCTLWVWIWPDLTSFICQICSIIQLKIFLIAVVISPLFSFLRNSVSIAKHSCFLELTFIQFSWLISLWSKNILCIFSILLTLLSTTLWPNISSILVNVTYALAKNGHLQLLSMVFYNVRFFVSLFCFFPAYVGYWKKSSVIYLDVWISLFQKFQIFCVLRIWF